jgi:hypothetical protein
MPYKQTKGNCHCFLCGGCERTTKTVRDHAAFARAEQIQLDRSSVYPIDIQEGRPAELHGAPVGLRRISADTRDLLDAYDIYFAQQDELDEALWDDDRHAPTLGLLITMHLDWISTFRASDVSAGHVWALLRSLLHVEGSNNPVATTTYARIKSFVAKHKLSTVEKIPICPCGLVIYYDFSAPDLREIYKFCSTDREGCALCGLSKYVPGTTVPRKVFYYISPEIWMRDLYQRADLAPLLRNDLDPAEFSSGSLRRSAGWKSKVTDNPDMMEDPRNAPIIAYADGGPYFKEQKTGGAWFFILRHACLPEEIALDQNLAHMTLLVPSSQWEDTLVPKTKTGERDGIFLKKIRYLYLLPASNVPSLP